MAYSAVTDRMLSVIKAPPIRAPYNLTYNTSAPYSAENNLGTLVFSLRARFVYDDNEKSAWGPTSDVQNYVGLIFPNGLKTSFYYTRQKLLVDFDIPDDETLLKMEIAVRIAEFGAWYIMDEIDVSGVLGTTYQYTFENDKVLIPVPDSDSNRPYDYVPLLSGAQQIIGGSDGSYLTLGDNTEGYDQVTGVTFASVLSTTAHTDPVTQIGVDRTSVTEFTILDNLASTIAAPEIYIMGNGEVHRVTANRFYWNSSTSTVGTMSENSTLEYLAAQIEKLDIISSAARNGTEIDIVFAGYYSNMEVLAYRYGLDDSFGSLKGGATHYLGLVYRDEFGRRGPLYTDSDMEVYVPHAGETNGVVEQYHELDITITHTPPIWAHSWELVYGETNILWYQQFLARTHDRADKSVFIEDGLVKIKINQGQNDVRNEMLNYVYPNYVFSSGDRIRLVATRDRETGALTKAPSTAYYDGEIIGFDGVSITVPNWDGDSALPDLDDTTDDLLFEIYRRKKESDDILYYGIGLDGAVNFPGTGYQALDDASSRSVRINDAYSVYGPLAYLDETGPYIVPDAGATTTSTTTTFAPYFSRDQMGGVAMCWHESKWQSAFVKESKVSAKGEVHIRDDDARQLRLNNIRYSGIHIDKSFINNLNRFNFDDDVALDDKHGRLFALKERGYTLKALQRSKLTSLYIGREMALDAKGNENVVYSDNVLGSKRPSQGSYGTQDPLSVLVTNRYLYFYDQNSGAIIRDSQGGQEEISKIGMEYYFRDWIDSADRVIAAHDRIDDMIYFTLVDDDTPANNITLGFDEIKGRWVSFYSFKPELYGSIGDKSFLSFVDGELWKHNDDSADRNTFYTTAYPSGIEIIANEHPEIIKTFEALELVGSQVWTADDNSNSYVVGIDRSLESADMFKMLSYLRLGDFLEYEGVWRAPFNFDLYTTNGTINNYDLHNGRELKGHYISIRLKNSSTERVNLLLVKVASDISK